MATNWEGEDSVLFTLLDAITEKRDEMLTATLPRPLIRAVANIQHHYPSITGDPSLQHESPSFYDQYSSTAGGHFDSVATQSDLNVSLLAHSTGSIRDSQYFGEMDVVRFNDAGIQQQEKLSYVDMVSFFDTFSIPKTGLTWLHARSARAVNAACSTLKLHPLVLQAFSSRDLQSSINHLDVHSVLLTSTSIYYDAAELHSHKLCIFGYTRHFLLSFETCVLDPSASGPRGLHTLNLHEDKIFLEALAALHVEDQMGEGAPVLQKMMLRRALGEHGAGFLIYLLLSELAVLGEDLAEEEFSRAVIELHARIQQSAAHRHRIQYLKDLSLLKQGLQLVADHVEPELGNYGSTGGYSTPYDSRRRTSQKTPKSEAVFTSRSKPLRAHSTSMEAKSSTRRSKASAGGKRWLFGGANSRHQQHNALPERIRNNTCIHKELWPYFCDLNNNAEAQLQRLETLEQTLPGMRRTLTYIGNLKSMSIDTTLSMVATIFLPLNFLAGIFGMNFDGGSGGQPPDGLGMLNDRFGGIYFWLIASGMVATVLFAFYHLGWIRNCQDVHPPSLPLRQEKLRLVSSTATRRRSSTGTGRRRSSASWNGSESAVWESGTGTELGKAPPMPNMATTKKPMAVKTLL